ncbi:MAG: hypothetical protein ACK56F_28075, partial [bacterium]
SKSLLSHILDILHELKLFVVVRIYHEAILELSKNGRTGFRCRVTHLKHHKRHKRYIFANYINRTILEGQAFLLILNLNAFRSLKQIDHLVRI